MITAKRSPLTDRGAFSCLLPIVCVFSGLGFIIGAGVASQTGDWHWAFRVRRLQRHSRTARRHTSLDLSASSD